MKSTFTVTLKYTYEEVYTDALVTHDVPLFTFDDQSKAEAVAQRINEKIQEERIDEELHAYVVEVSIVD